MEIIKDIPGDNETPTAQTTEDLINSFKNGMPDPNLPTPEQEKKQAEQNTITFDFNGIPKYDGSNTVHEAIPIDPLKEYILKEGVIEGFIVNILSTVLVWLNVWGYNMLVKDKFIERADIELDEEDKMKIKMVFQKHGKVILDLVKNLPSEVIAIGFLEYSIIGQMKMMAQPIPVKEKKPKQPENETKDTTKTPPKEEAKEEKKDSAK